MFKAHSEALILFPFFPIFGIYIDPYLSAHVLLAPRVKHFHPSDCFATQSYFCQIIDQSPVSRHNPPYPLWFSSYKDACVGTYCSFERWNPSHKISHMAKDCWFERIQISILANAVMGTAGCLQRTWHCRAVSDSREKLSHVISNAANTKWVLARGSDPAL